MCIRDSTKLGCVVHAIVLSLSDAVERGTFRVPLFYEGLHEGSYDGLYGRHLHLSMNESCDVKAEDYAIGRRLV